MRREGREIGRAGPNVELAEHHVVTRVAPGRGRSAARTGLVGEMDLLARRLYNAFGDRRARLIRGDPRPGDPFDAISAFLHHSAGPPRHLRAALQLNGRGRACGAVQVVELADLAGGSSRSSRGC